MKGVNEIKARIGGVQDTVKITKAMYLISAAKSGKRMADLAAGNTYLAAVEHAVAGLMHPRYLASPYRATEKVASTTGYVVIAGDKGLAGDYNHLVLDYAWERIQTTAERKIFAVGYMAKEFFATKGVRANSAYLHMLQRPLVEDAGTIAARLVQDAVSGKLGEVYLVYTRANHLFDQEVVCERLLPLPYPDAEEPVATAIPTTDVNNLMQRLLEAKIYCALVNAAAAINYKHMTNMQKATNNGEEMLNRLTQSYHQACQAAITGELIDVNVARMANEER